jgi:hypothetical protein
MVILNDLYYDDQVIPKIIFLICLVMSLNRLNFQKKIGQIVLHQAIKQ